jgi:hypothetical protein
MSLNLLLLIELCASWKPSRHHAMAFEMAKVSMSANTLDFDDVKSFENYSQTWNTHFPHNFLIQAHSRPLLIQIRKT